MSGSHPAISKGSTAKPAPPAELSVGQVAGRSGVTVATLHFYEAKGLIVSRRNSGNQRRYARDVLRRVAIIKVAQRVGIPLASIQAALQSLPQQRTPTAADWARMSARWKSELNERIRALTQLRDQLDGCIGCGCLSIKQCPLRNPWDELSRQGPGPRLLMGAPSAARLPAERAEVRGSACAVMDGLKG